MKKNFSRIIFVLQYVFTLALTACSHSISFRASHFAVPIVSEKQFSGHIAAVITSSTDVTIINDITTNPPQRTSLLVNKDFSPYNIFYLNNIGIDAGLSIYNSTEIFIDSSLLGLRWQFLNPGAKSQTWVGALQGAYGARNSTTTVNGSTTNSTASSDVKTSQAGVSLGYQLNSIVPYFSYLYEQHDVSTTVTNPNGNFGPYLDTGKHQYYSLGITSIGSRLKYGLEVNFINISWDRAASSSSSQNTMGAKLGYAW